MFEFLHGRKAGFSDLHFTEDVHCHILPGVDDGVQEFDESVAVLRRMASLGIRKVTLTPHMNPDIYRDNTEDFIRGRYEQFIRELPKDIPVELSLGGEYMVVEGFEKRKPQDLFQFREGCVLIEMSYYYISHNMEDAIFNLTMAGLHPVIAHPERYLYLADHLSVFDRFYDMGASFQLNLLSLGGVYGSKSLHIMEYLLKNGWYTHRGTDTHSLGHLMNIAGLQYPKSILSKGLLDITY